MMEMIELPLETGRLLLRDFHVDDWEQVHAYARDPEVARFQDSGPHSEAESRAFVAGAVARAEQKPRKVYEFAVIFKNTGTLVGDAALKVPDEDPHSAELSYTLHRLAWGQGLGTELARELVDFGFLHLPVRRIWAKCRPENVGSYRVMKKAGLRFQEYVQNDRTARGQLVDSFLCAISRQEWLHAFKASASPGRDC
jgi:RimJ/RimL family protein N-acetyltransferase